ncbi:hypothetical protein ACJRO7_011968 [Eucalyptus globulus]|uniref:Uncharacterized protein n=1 Tax=Eucalyptus globulus TaxID=34317 RepID=A0ABD3LHX5_EUCGL
MSVAPWQISCPTTPQSQRRLLQLPSPSDQPSCRDVGPLRPSELRHHWPQVHRLVVENPLGAGQIHDAVVAIRRAWPALGNTRWRICAVVYGTPNGEHGGSVGTRWDGSNGARGIGWTKGITASLEPF